MTRTTSRRPAALRLVGLSAALLALGVTATPANAQEGTTRLRDDSAPNWTLQVDPLTTALGFVHLQLERALGERASVYLGPHLRLFNGITSDAEDDFQGLGVELGLRFFFTGRAPEGAWAMTRTVTAQVTTDATGETQTSFGGYTSVLGGYTWIVDRWLVLSAGAGVQYIYYTVGEQGIEGVLPALHTAAGFAF